MAVSSKPSGRLLRKPECQKYCDESAEYSVCDGRPNGDVGGRKLQRLEHAAVGKIPWSSVPKTPMNSHGQLVLTVRSN